MLRSLVWRSRAEDDLAGIFEYIAADDPERAMAFVTDIRRRCRVLETIPELGPARPDIHEGLRILPMDRRIVVAYSITPETIEVLRVFSRGQDYQALMAEV